MLFNFHLEFDQMQNTKLEKVLLCPVELSTDKPPRTSVMLPGDSTGKLSELKLFVTCAEEEKNQDGVKQLHKMDHFEIKVK